MSHHILAIGTKRKPPFRIPVEALRSHCGNTKRGERHALPLQDIVHVEISQVSTGDCFAAMQLNCYIRGWKGRSASIRRLTLPVSSRTMSASVWSTAPTVFLAKARVLYHTILANGKSGFLSFFILLICQRLFRSEFSKPGFCQGRLNPVGRHNARIETSTRDDWVRYFITAPKRRASEAMS